MKVTNEDDQVVIRMTREEAGDWAVSLNRAAAVERWAMKAGVLSRESPDPASFDELADQVFVARKA